MKYMSLILVGLLAGCASPYKSPNHVIAKTCAVIAAKSPNRCADDIMVRYVVSSGRLHGRALGRQAILLDARCQHVDWRYASICVHMLAHEVAHTVGLASENEANYIAGRVWYIVS